MKLSQKQKVKRKRNTSNEIIDEPLQKRQKLVPLDHYSM